MDKRVIDDPDSLVNRTSRVVRFADGRRIGYAQYGAAGGLPVVALHGTPGARTTFGLMDEAAWERGLRIIALDRPGYGLSDVHHFDTLLDTASDIEIVADALGLDRFALLGYSGGAPYALAAASRLESRISRVALISPVGLVTEIDQVSLSPLQHYIFSYLGRSPLAASAYFFWVRSLVFWVPGSVEQLLTQYATRSDRELLRRREMGTYFDVMMRDALRMSVEGALQDLRLYCKPWNLPLGGIEAPVVILQGTKDAIAPPEASYRLARALPNCRLEKIEGMGHYWAFSAVDRVLDTVRETWR